MYIFLYPFTCPMAFAVTGLSPVIIITRMPASCSASMLGPTSTRGGSIIPNKWKN